MSQLRTSLRPASTWLSPLLTVLAAILLQSLLLSAFFYLDVHGRISLDPLELNLLLAYSAIAIVIALASGILRYRWVQNENHVRQRLLDVIDAIPDPAAVRDAKGKYVIWNKAAESYHGVKAEYVLGKTPFDLFPKEVARNILELDAECSEARSIIVRRLVLPPLYGKGQRVANIRIAPVHSTPQSDAAEYKNIRGVVTILHDITESEREAAALKHMSTQLKMALDTSGFGSWIWDLDHNYVTYSPQYQTLLRYKGKSFNQDFDFRAHIHPGDAEMVISGAKKAIKENLVYDQVYRLRCFDDVYRVFHVSGEPALDDKGRRYFAGLLCPLDRSAD